MTTVTRKTKETDITLTLNPYGEGKSTIHTGIGFFDHMLESLAKHALWDVTLSVKGDLHVDGHHTVEDVGIVLGEALSKSIYPIEKIERFGNSIVVMDEASVACDCDISGRPFLVYSVAVDGKVGDFECELVEEFFRAFAYNARITLHLTMQRGKNRHHIIEATFKALAVSMRRALSRNENITVPSTKGVI